MAEGDFIQPVDFKARYEEFDGLTDAKVDVYLAEARLFVDTSWPEKARAKAQGLVTAHQLLLEGKASGGAGGLAEITSDGVKSLRIEEFIDVDFQDKDSSSSASGADDDPFLKTNYGREFLALRRKYFGGGIVV